MRIKILPIFGFDFYKFYLSLRYLPLYINDFYNFQRSSKNCNSVIRIKKLYPCLTDRYSGGGTSSGHYFHQDLLIANRIFLNNPKRHIDIGSRIDGFCAHVASFREIEVIDIRKNDNKIHNITFKCIDLTVENNIANNYYDSCSCLHALEHFGLGRYGDTLDALGHIKGFVNITKLISPGGKFYLSVPIGTQRIEFNAHRIFDVQTIIDMVSEDYVLDYFSYVDDKGALHENVDLFPELVLKNFHCEYGCGIFELTKRK